MWVLGLCVVGFCAVMWLENKFLRDEHSMAINVWFSSAFGITGIFALVLDSWKRTCDMPYLYASELEGVQFRALFYLLMALFLASVVACLIAGYRSALRTTHKEDFHHVFWWRLTPIPVILLLAILQIFVATAAVRETADAEQPATQKMGNR